MILPRLRAREIGEQIRTLISSVFGFRLDTTKEIFSSEAKILGMIYKISPTGGQMKCELSRISGLIADIDALTSRIANAKTISQVKWVDLAFITGKAIFISLASELLDIHFSAANLSACIPYEKVMEADFSKSVPLFSFGSKRWIANRNLPSFAVIDRLNSLKSALIGYRHYTFSAPSPHNEFVFAFSDASASTEESSIGFMWKAFRADNTHIKSKAVRIVLDETAILKFRRPSTPDDIEDTPSDPEVITDIRLSETAAVHLCCEDIKKHMNSPIIWPNCDNLNCVYAICGRKVPNGRMFKMASTILKSQGSFDDSHCTQVIYIPTDWNPSDGLTRASLISEWMRTFPDLVICEVPPNVLYHLQTEIGRRPVNDCRPLKRRKAKR